MTDSLNLIAPDLLRAFGFSGKDSLSVLAGGHINDTFLVNSQDGDFVLQRINRFVFPHPAEIMENMIGVTEFLRKKITAEGGNPDRETLTVRRTLDGAGYFLDSNGEYWRCTNYIAHSPVEGAVGDPKLLMQAGIAFGKFQKMLADYPAHTLHEIIPDFHNTPARFGHLKDAVAMDKAGRVQDVAAELEFAYQREKDCAALTNLLKENKLPLKVTHNDTKMSNVLLDEESGNAICVIDLDTVMPGLTAFDFGDSIRAGASTAAEDEVDLSKVHFDLSLFEGYTKGFLLAAEGTLTPAELASLPIGSKLMTFEVGIRFLTDYLNGDVYFRTAYPQHNLDRARNQFKLVADMEAAEKEMLDIVLRYA